MNNKKIWLIILLAGILALLVASFIFDNTKQEPKTETAIEQQEPIAEETEVLPATEKEVTEIKEEKQEKPIVSKPVQQKPVVKTQKPTTPAVQTVSETKEAVEEAVKEETSQVQVEDDSLIIPVRYNTQSTYKYVYTPANFNKK